MVVINSNEKPNKPTQNKPMGLIFGLTAIAVIIVGALGIRALNTPKAKAPEITKSSKPKPSSTAPSSSTPTTPEEVAVSELEKEVKDTGKPYDIESLDIGAGYTFANITYHKGDNQREYDEKRIIAPQTKVEEAQDEQANNLRAQLTAELPQINFGKKKTIVRDGSQVGLEVYAVSGENPYLVILNYAGQPFGYVRVNAAGEMMPTITSYALDQVVDHNIGNELKGNVENLQ